ERLFWGKPEEHTITPCTCEECAHITYNSSPEEVVIWFKHHPLCTTFNRFFDVVKQSTHIDIAPGRITTQGACAPDAHTTTRKRPNAIDARRIEGVLPPFGYRCTCF